LKRPARWRLSRRLLWSFSLLAVIPILVVGVGVRQYTRTLLQRSLDRRVDLTRRLIDNRAEQLGATARSAARTLATDSLVIEAGGHAERQRLQTTVDRLAQQSGVDGIDVAERRAGGLVLLVRSDHASHFGFPVRMTPGSGDVSVWPAPELGTTCYGVAVNAGNDSAVVVAAYFRLDSLLLSSLAEAGEFSLGVNGLHDSAIVVGELQVSHWPEVSDSPSDVVRVESRDAHFAVGRTGPFYFALSLAENAAALNRLDLFLLVAVLLAIAVALIAAWRVAVSAARPVEELAATVEQWGRGRTPKPLVTFAEGETATLADAFEHLRRELVVAERRLADAARASGWQEMARKVAHEIKNPLTPIRITVEDLARRAERTPDQAAALIPEAARLVSEEVATLGRIVDSFARFARLPDPQPKAVDLNEIAAHLAQLYGSEKGTKIALEPAPEAATVMADPELLREAVGNLLKNAVEASGPEGRVEVQVTVAPKSCAMRITDSGPGFPAALVAEGPRPYFTTKPGGTGLGLMVAQRVVTDMGGELVLSNGDAGAVATVTFARRK